MSAVTREEIAALTPRDWFAARPRARGSPGSEVPPSEGSLPGGNDTG